MSTVEHKSMSISSLTRISVAATFIRVGPANSPGDFPSLSRSLRYSSCSQSVGSFPSPPVGSLRLAAKKRLATFLDVSVVKLVKMLARPKLSSRTSVTSLNSNLRPPRASLTFPCFSVSALASSTLVVVYSSLSGSRSCKSGSVLLV